jgi:hypothetical protein
MGRPRLPQEASCLCPSPINYSNYARPNRILDNDSENIRRRAIVDRVKARAERHGLLIDPDPVVNDLFEAWVNGEHSLKEIRARYLDHLSQREQAKTDWRMLSIGAELARLRR